jgi:ribose/xylose/arabinose/galactoside ABC-type transport system permease subunit
LIIIGVSQFIQEIVIGFALIIAIAFDSWVRRFVRISAMEVVPRKKAGTPLSEQ